MTTIIPHTSDELATERTELAIERTVMAAGRTLMGWVRTAMAMIGFGFTIYKFLKAMLLQAAAHGAELGAFAAQRPRRLGLFLIALGVVSVLLGSIEYYRTIRRMNTLSARKYPVVNVSLVVGMLIGLLGLFLFITIITRMEIF